MAEDEKEIVRRFLARVGAEGGKAKGETKVRGDSEYYRSLSLKRKRKGLKRKGVK